MMQMMMEILPLPKSMFYFWICKRQEVAADDDDDDNLCFFMAHEGHAQKKYPNFCFLKKWGWNCSYE